MLLAGSNLKIETVLQTRQPVICKGYVYRYGFFNNKRIVLFDTLVEQCSESQVVAVLAHELGELIHFSDALKPTSSSVACRLPAPQTLPSCI